MSEPPMNDELLIRYAMDDLDSAETAAIESYVMSTPMAAAYVERVRHVVKAMRADDSQPATVDAVQRAIEAFAAPAAESVEPPRPSVLQGIKTFIARLVYDSRAQTAMAGFRAGHALEFRQVYECDAASVHLTAAPIADDPSQSWRVRGQVSDADIDGGGTVELIRRGGTAEKVPPPASLDRHGQFRLESPPGEYDLHITLEGGTVVVSELLLA